MCRRHRLELGADHPRGTLERVSHTSSSTNDQASERLPFRYLPHTFLLSIHLCLLIVWPVIHALGLPSIYDKGVYDRYRMTKLLADLQ